MDDIQNELYQVVEKAKLYDKLIKIQGRFNKLSCSFCGKFQEDVEKLIAGANVYICNECVEICVEIINEKETDVDVNLNAEEGGSNL